MKTMQEMQFELEELQRRFNNIHTDIANLVQLENKKKWLVKPQCETFFGIFTALCVSTIDPWKQNRVRFFSPLFHRPDTPIKSLPFALPISAAGGFDDCGLSWVPPAGSTLCISFENGSRQCPYYHGTTWHRDRGPDGQHNWGYNIDEYYKIHEGHRKGYLVGPNDGSQVFAQWNTQNSNGYDLDSLEDFENDPDAQRKITYAHIYGLKSPGKHMLKLDDGNYDCNHRGRMLELGTGNGIRLCMKDDHLHDISTYAHPNGGGSGGPLDCIDANGNPTEKTECQGKSSNGSILGGHPSTPDSPTNKGSNPYFKHENESYPFKGPGTPQNNKYELPQSGAQLLTRSGQSFIMDDSVEEPRGIPEWEITQKDFDFGCNNVFKGHITLKSATGQIVKLSDDESTEQLRSDKNGIFLSSATGNVIYLNDHTTGPGKCQGSPPNVAGEQNGVVIISNANHHIMMMNEGNEKEEKCRQQGTEVTYDSSGSHNPARAKAAYLRLRTGYGSEILMKDEGSQEKTVSQHIRIYSPQKDNKDRGPHIMHFQEKKEGPGLVFLRVGGNYIVSVHDNHYMAIGDKDKNPANQITIVSKHNIVKTEEFYYNVANTHAFFAEEAILLMAGNDCKNPDGSCGPCVYPILVMTPGGIRASDRVFATTSPDSACVSVLQLSPFHSCTPAESC